MIETCKVKINGLVFKEKLFLFVYLIPRNSTIVHRTKKFLFSNKIIRLLPNRKLNMFGEYGFKRLKGLSYESLLSCWVLKYKNQYRKYWIKNLESCYFSFAMNNIVDSKKFKLRLRTVSWNNLLLITYFPQLKLKENYLLQSLQLQ